MIIDRMIFETQRFWNFRDSAIRLEILKLLIFETLDNFLFFIFIAQLRLSEKYLLRNIFILNFLIFQKPGIFLISEIVIPDYCQMILNFRNFDLWPMQVLIKNVWWLSMPIPPTTHIFLIFFLLVYVINCELIICDF